MTWARLLSILAFGVLMGGCAAVGLGTSPRPQPVVVAGAPDGPLLQFTMADHGIRTRLQRAAVNGPVETWVSTDGFSVSTHGGVIVATRGFGDDLMAADPQPILAALADPTGAGYARRMRYLTADNKSTWIAAGCRMTPADNEAGQRRFDERCDSIRMRFVNSYWLDQAGRIVRARQWVSPEIGYLETAPVRPPAERQ